MSLFDEEIPDPDPIQIRFEEFDAAHPEVYELFRNLCRVVRAAGHSRYSADAILHRVRWDFDVNPNKDMDGRFKINDHFSSRYARKLIQRDPSFDGFFELRELGANRKEL